MMPARTRIAITLAATCLWVSGCEVKFARFPAHPSLQSAPQEAAADTSDRRPRWKLPKGRIAHRPICADFRAPALPDPMPPEGVIPAFLFAVDKASEEHIKNHRAVMIANGFALGDGTVTINGTKILFATGDGGVLKTQSRTDLLYKVICALDGPQIQMVSMRLNIVSEYNRMS